MHFLTLGKTLLICPFLAGWLLSRARIDPALTARLKLVPQRRVVVKHFHLEQVLQFPKQACNSAELEALAAEPAARGH